MISLMYCFNFAVEISSKLLSTWVAIRLLPKFALPKPRTWPTSCYAICSIWSLVNLNRYECSNKNIRFSYKSISINNFLSYQPFHFYFSWSPSVYLHYTYFAFTGMLIPPFSHPMLLSNYILQSLVFLIH